MPPVSSSISYWKLYDEMGHYMGTIEMLSHPKGYTMIRHFGTRTRHSISERDLDRLLRRAEYVSTDKAFWR